MQVIRKSITCFAILMAAHWLLVLLCPGAGMPTHQWQDNLVKAQTFLYAEHCDTAMVGTSLSGRILRDSIPTVRSVSFGGCAVEDGLRIVSHREQLPRYVLVETNLFLNEGNDEMVSNLSEGVVPWIKSVVPSLREQYEPICLLASVLMKSGNINAQAGAAVVDTVLLNDRIAQHLRDAKGIDQQKAEQRLHTLQGLMAPLEAKGVRFVFFEMPVNPRLQHLKSYDQTRDMVQRAFPPEKYKYLPADTAQYLTTDGEHLDYEGQQRFSAFIKRQLEKMD